MEQIGGLTNLRGCNLENNRLSGNIPESIANLSLLQSLYLNNNELVGTVPSGLCNLANLEYIYLSSNFLTGIPNFYNQVNKSNLTLRVNHNYLGFDDFEPIFENSPHGIKTFGYSPQRSFDFVVKMHVPEGSQLTIESNNPGINSTIIWEKLSGSTWQNVNSQSEDGTLMTFKISDVTMTSGGTYRWRMTNSLVTGLSLISAPITVEIVDELPATVSTDALYNGLITSVRWRTDPAHGTGDEKFKGMYTFKYDDKYQIKEATWADPLNLTSTTNKFRLMGMDYDPNGNILSLKRYDAQGNRMHNLAYQYNVEPAVQKTNQLQSISGYSTYHYNAIGQMTGEDKVGSENDQYVDYDVTGKVKKVFSDAAKTQLKVEFIYDDRGFRLAKVNHVSDRTTWYIRDASGNVMSIYEQDGIVENTNGTPVVNTEPLSHTEVPIYGSAKLGTYYPNDEGSTAYEITDHLGNVRALVRDDINIYAATMEDNGQAEYTNPRVQEMVFFKNLFETEVDDPHMNHTPGDATIVAEPSRSAYLFWQDGVQDMDAEDKAIGPSAALRVKSGDQIELETWVRYRKETDYTNDVTLLMLSQLLGSTFSGTGGFEGSSMAETASAFESALGNGGFDSDGSDETRPFAYLNFILFNDNLQMLDAGWRRVPIEAGFDPGEEGLPDKHQKISFDQPLNVTETGYIYVWVSNESENVRVWFDDLKITHSEAIVVQATDYGTWGEVLREQKADESIYRFGYQGQFSEKDAETGWNHFELREYDSWVGRWMAIDPKRQFHSPYIGIGNNPISRTDPDGGSTNDKFKVAKDGTVTLMERTNDNFHSFYNERGKLLFTTNLALNEVFKIWDENSYGRPEDLEAVFRSIITVQLAMRSNPALFNDMVARADELGWDPFIIEKMMYDGSVNKYGEWMGIGIDVLRGKALEKVIGNKTPEDPSIVNKIYHGFTDRNLFDDLKRFVKDSYQDTKHFMNNVRSEFNAGVHSVNSYGTN